MKGIYLAAFKAFHPGYDILYQDINGKRDIGGDLNRYKASFNLQNLSTNKRQGTNEVHFVIDSFLSIIHGGIFNDR